jgi:hypothetical protein
MNCPDRASEGGGGSGRDTLGVFDLRTYRRADVLAGAGFGGGSLLYSNVFMVHIRRAPAILL